MMLLNGLKKKSNKINFEFLKDYSSFSVENIWDEDKGMGKDLVAELIMVK